MGARGPDTDRRPRGVAWQGQRRPAKPPPYGRNPLELAHRTSTFLAKSTATRPVRTTSREAQQRTHPRRQRVCPGACRKPVERISDQAETRRLPDILHHPRRHVDLQRGPAQASTRDRDAGCGSAAADRARQDADGVEAARAAPCAADAQRAGHPPRRGRCLRGRRQDVRVGAPADAAAEARGPE